jgi:hypothetical protein
MPGTSGKPVVQKLGIKPGFRIFTTGAPAACDGHRRRVTGTGRRRARLRVAVGMIHVFAKATATGDKLAPSMTFGPP